MNKWNGKWANHIESGVFNEAIAQWHRNQPPREQDCATPSTMTECPRVVWFKYVKKLPAPIPLGWGKAQRLLHGRVFENIIANQLKESGNLLYHWKDDTEGESVKFEMGEGDKRIAGTPDLLLKIGKEVAISDAKTSMGKSFGYIPLDKSVFNDFMWFKYQLQVEAYYMLCHKNKDWFEKNKLPLPTINHLFSYALDDGVVRREFLWKSTQETASKIVYYVTRWNKAYASKEMPDCTCDEGDGAQRKFCYYTTRQEPTRTGYMLGVECCNDNLIKEN